MSYKITTRISPHMQHPSWEFTCPNDGVCCITDVEKKLIEYQYAQLGQKCLLRVLNGELKNETKKKYELVLKNISSISYQFYSPSDSRHFELSYSLEELKKLKLITGLYQLVFTINYSSLNPLLNKPDSMQIDHSLEVETSPYAQLFRAHKTLTKASSLKTILDAIQSIVNLNGTVNEEHIEMLNERIKFEFSKLESQQDKKSFEFYDLLNDFVTLLYQCFTLLRDPHHKESHDKIKKMVYFKQVSNPGGYDFFTFHDEEFKKLYDLIFRLLNYFELNDEPKKITLQIVGFSQLPDCIKSSLKVHDLPQPSGCLIAVYPKNSLKGLSGLMDFLCFDRNVRVICTDKVKMSQLFQKMGFLVFVSSDYYNDMIRCQLVENSTFIHGIPRKYIKKIILHPNSKEDFQKLNEDDRSIKKIHGSFFENALNEADPKILEQFRKTLYSPIDLQIDDNRCEKTSFGSVVEFNQNGCDDPKVVFREQKN